MGIRMTGFKEHEAANANRLAKTKDQTKIMQQLSGLYMTSEHPKIFREQKAPSGIKWVALTAATLRAYVREFKGTIPGGLLRRKGDLSRSVFRKVKKHGFSIASNHVSAATHQFGRGGIPARPFIGYSKRFRRTAIRLQEKWLSSGDKA